MLESESGGAWPHAELREELLRLNREYMKDSHLPFLRGHESWPNLAPDLFEEELASAKGLGIVPLAPEQRAFFELLNSGQRFNWAILPDGSVRISPTMVQTDSGAIRISHAILCYNGGDVLAAGDGKLDQYLSNNTGHYQNEEFVLPPVKAAFAGIGVHFGA